ARRRGQIGTATVGCDEGAGSVVEIPASGSSREQRAWPQLALDACKPRHWRRAGAGRGPATAGKGTGAFLARCDRSHAAGGVVRLSGDLDRGHRGSISPPVQVGRRPGDLFVSFTIYRAKTPEQT